METVTSTLSENGVDPTPIIEALKLVALLVQLLLSLRSLLAENVVEESEEDNLEAADEGLDLLEAVAAVDALALVLPLRAGLLP